MTLITSRMPRSEYDAIAAVSITRLKNLLRSPMHYQYALQVSKSSAPLTLGIATHTSTLEPERFSSDFAVWSNRTESGRMSPRNGKKWDEFAELNAHRTILTLDEAIEANAIAAAVRSDENAIRYLACGEPEVSLEFSMCGRPCKGRVDWITHIGGKPVLVGLKTARDCRHFSFASQAAKLGYHLQWAFYHDGYTEIRKVEPRMVEIVVESEAPYAVAVYNIPRDIIDQGREEYLRLMDILDRCEKLNEWPGPVEHEEDLTLPTWAYPRDEDLSDLGLEAIA